MNSSIQLAQLNRFLKHKEEKEEGFSLIELVVVVSILAILSAIALPNFSCFVNKARATAALTTLKQIQTECAVKKAESGITGTFMARNLEGYEIQSNGFNSCNGEANSGLIRAIPYDTTTLPTFILATNSFELTYNFKGQTGNNITNCMNLICESTGLIAAPEPDPDCGPNCFVDNGACVCIECQAYGPGLCGMAPCGDPFWEGTGYCSDSDLGEDPVAPPPSLMQEEGRAILH